MPRSRFLTRLSDAPAELTLVALAVTVMLVIALKAHTGRGTPLRGGFPSGHAAISLPHTPLRRSGRAHARRTRRDRHARDRAEGAHGTWDIAPWRFSVWPCRDLASSHASPTLRPSSRSSHSP